MKKLLIISILFISFSGCRTVKKEWVKENFVSNADLTKLEQDILYSNERLKNEITGTFKSNIQELKNETETKTNENEKENLVISGTLEAEDGKEKSVSFGNTTIKSNGTDVKFESTTTKETSKAVESLKTEIYKKFDSVSRRNQNLEKDFATLKQQFANYVSTQKTESNSFSKTVDKKQLGFGIMILLVVVGVYFLARKKYSWLP